MFRCAFIFSDFFFPLEHENANPLNLPILFFLKKNHIFSIKLLTFAYISFTFVFRNLVILILFLYFLSLILSFSFHCFPTPLPLTLVIFLYILEYINICPLPSDLIFFIIIFRTLLLNIHLNILILLLQFFFIPSYFIQFVSFSS